MPDQHTPGPWERLADISCAISSVTGELVAVVTHCDGEDANLRLIAAAPDLLAALERFAKWSMQGSYPEIQGIITDAHEAIRKARGEDA